MSSAIRNLVDEQLEKATLGACLIDPVQLVDVTDKLSPDDFFMSSHRYIYKALLDLWAAEKPIEPLSVLDAIRVYTEPNNIGNGTKRGSEYIVDLMTADDSFSYSASHYAGQVAELSRRRTIVQSCQITVKQALDRGVSLNEVVELGTQGILKASANGANGLRPMSDDLTEFGHDLQERLDNPDSKAPGILTGFIDIDKKTSGLEQSKLWVIAGRPGMGKTGWLVSLTCMLGVCQDYNIAIFSLEMSREELYSRLVAYEAGVDLQGLAKGRLTDKEKHRVSKAWERIDNARDRIWIDDTPALTPTQMRARGHQMDMRVPGGLDLIWIDYLQLIHVPEAQGSNYVQATVASREAKNLAKHLHVPVIAASQLSRKVEQRNDKRPQLSDLRDSGGIEEAADLVGFLYRPEYYDEVTPVANSGEFIVPKHRNGPNFKAILHFDSICAGYRNADLRNINDE